MICPIKPTSGLIVERESAYNFIQVVQRDAAVPEDAPRSSGASDRDGDSE